MINTGKLYIVGTPIGNMGDITYRAVEVLKTVDFIAAEDTRVTQKLLNKLEIKKPTISYYEHNLRQRGEEIAARIICGENCAIVSDAGMPCISDPGEDLVKLCAEKGIETLVIPGANAAVSALCVSGLSTSRFSFEGFLSTNKQSRTEHLNSLKLAHNTLIFYEAPHKLLNTLKDMLVAFGDRKVSVVKEITKIYETVNRLTLSESVEYYVAHPPKGEYVLIIEGAPTSDDGELSLADAVALAFEFVQKGERPAEAAKQAAAISSYKKSDIYKAILDMKSEDA